jgi:hypothetical protein
MSQLLEDLGLELGAAPNGATPDLAFQRVLGGLTGGALTLPGEYGIPDPVAEPAQCQTYLDAQRQVLQAARKMRPTIRITDGNLDAMCFLTGEISASVEELMDDTGKCTITILYDNWLEDWMINQTMVTEDLNLLIDPIPTQPDWRTRWGGKITEIHIKKDEKGAHTIELTALHFREHAKRLLVAANPIFPPEIQLPRMWIMLGPVRTMCAVTSLINLARIFVPGLSTWDNILNPAGWLNPLNAGAIANVIPTEWPIQVAFVDTALDQSRWSSIGATWTDWHNSYKDIMTDAGVVMKAYTYLTTDPDSPNTELVDLLTAVPDLVGGLLGVNLSGLNADLAKLAAPLRNCVVFSFENKSGVTGPTGSVADGLLDTVAITLDDLITPIAIDLSTGNTYDPGAVLNGEPVEDASGIGQTQLIEQLLDVAPAPPSVIWWDGMWNGVINTDLLWHKGSPKTIMTGSKSPVIVNEAQTFAIRYALSELSSVISDQIGQTYQTPGAPGLDNLYQGQLDNVLFAWERFTDPIRAFFNGDVSWQEHFEKGSGTAYTLASIITLRDGDWKTRAFAAFKATPQDGYPWIYDYDYYLGDRVGFEQDGVIYVDNVYGAKREWDWKSPLKVTIKIGEDKMKSDPFGAAFKTMANIYAFVSELAGEGTLFDG